MHNILCVGEIVNTHGVTGELKIMPLTDDINDFKNYTEVFIDGKIYKIMQVRFHQKFVLLRIEGIDDKTVAEKYKGKFLELPREMLKTLPENNYYICDLIGLKIIDTNLGEIGPVKDIIQTGSNNAYLTVYNGKELCIPILKGVVDEVNIDEGFIILTIPKGLI